MSHSGAHRFMNNVSRRFNTTKQHYRDRGETVTVTTITERTTYIEKMSKKEFMIKRLKGEYDNIKRLHE